MILNEFSLISQELVDSIHDEQNDKILMGIPCLSDNIRKWIKNEQLPIDQESLITMAIIENREEKRRLETIISEKDFEQTRDKLRELANLCKRY